MVYLRYGFYSSTFTKSSTINLWQDPKYATPSLIVRELRKIGIINSTEEKALGITSDNKLDFSTHLTSITKTANIKLNSLTKVQKYMTPEQKVSFTSSFIKSQFNYCPLIWMFCSKKALYRLNNLHVGPCALCIKIMSLTLLHF